MHDVTTISILLTLNKPGEDCEPSLVSLGSASSASHVGETSAHVRLVLLWSLNLVLLACNCEAEEQKDTSPRGLWKTSWEQRESKPKCSVEKNIPLHLHLNIAGRWGVCEGLICMHHCQAGPEGSIGTSLGWERFSDDLRKVLMRHCVSGCHLLS